MIIKDNIFRRKFRAYELDTWFNNTFPDSFSIEIYRSGNPDEINYDKDLVWDLCSNGHRKHYHPKHRTEYTLYHRPIFNVFTGDENTYPYFVIMDENANYYTVRWGYKRSMEDYAAVLKELIAETCKLPPLQRYDFCLVALREYYK